MRIVVLPLFTRNTHPQSSPVACWPRCWNSLWILINKLHLLKHTYAPLLIHLQFNQPYLFPTFGQIKSIGWFDFFPFLTRGRQGGFFLIYLLPHNIPPPLVWNGLQLERGCFPSCSPRWRCHFLNAFGNNTRCPIRPRMICCATMVVKQMEVPFLCSVGKTTFGLRAVTYTPVVFTKVTILWGRQGEMWSSNMPNQNSKTWAGEAIKESVLFGDFQVMPISA